MGNPTVVLLPVQVPADVPFQGIILSPFLTSPGFVGVSLLLWGATLMCLRVLLRCCMIQLRNSSPKNGGGVSRVVSPVCKPDGCCVFQPVQFLWRPSFISVTGFVLFPALLTPAHAFLHPLPSLPSSPGCLAGWARRNWAFIKAADTWLSKPDGNGVTIARGGKCRALGHVAAADKENLEVEELEISDLLPDEAGGTNGDARAGF